MANINNAKKYNYDIQDHIELEKIRHKITDPKWLNHGLTTKQKFYNSSTQINLGKHENHNWQPVVGPFGPHAGKIICKTCGGKWIKWLPKGSI